MKSRTLIMAAVTALPAVAIGQNTVSHTCTMGDTVRRVEILYEPGRRVPCEVHYFKDSESPGERQVLWSASNQEGYCEQKTEAFLAQLSGWGWSCGPSGATIAESAPPASSESVPQEPVEGDDTAELEPVSSDAPD